MIESGVIEGRKVLVVDDDDLFRDLVTQNLEDKGFAVTAYPNGPSLLSDIGNRRESEILLLDWMMPGMTGIEVLRRLRADNHGIPVIFLTILGDQVYEESALLGGAVDFVEKSRSFSILLKRIEVALSGAKTAGNGNGQKPKAYTMLGDIELLPDRKRAFWKGTKVGLTITEFHVVWNMIENAGRDISYRELYDIVHSEGFVGGYGEIGYRTNVRALVKRIRQKFRDIDPEFDRIENYPGFGYRWRDAAGP